MKIPLTVGEMTLSAAIQRAVYTLSVCHSRWLRDNGPARLAEIKVFRKRLPEFLKRSRVWPCRKGGRTAGIGLRVYAPHVLRYGV